MKNIKKDILKKISKEEVKMTPKWQFTLRDLGKKGSLAAAMLLAATGLSVMVYFWEKYNPADLITNYGEVGRELVLEDFPYIWLTAAVILIIGGVILVSKIGENYKKTTITLLLLVAVIVVVLTVGLSTGARLLQLGI